MRKKHLSFRLSDNAISVIVAHQRELAAVHHRKFNSTEALEDLLLNPPKKSGFSSFFHRKKVSSAGTISLEAFPSA